MTTLARGRTVMRLLVMVPIVYVGALVVVAGCRTAAPPPSGSQRGHPTPPPPALTRTLDVLGCDEIRSDPVGIDNAYDAVTRLRPHFLLSGLGFPELPVVYLNDMRQGGPDQLHSIPVSVILEIRYFTPVTADLRFNTNNLGGAIAVRTYRDVSAQRGPVSCGER